MRFQGFHKVRETQRVYKDQIRSRGGILKLPLPPYEILATCPVKILKNHLLFACWDSHSLRNVSKSTCTPLAANFLCCLSKLLSNFFCLRSRSLRRSSSAGIGSPEHVTGCALCAGRPGPFLVCSFFLHLARRFWNHTYQKKKKKSFSMFIRYQLRKSTLYCRREIEKAARGEEFNI